MPLPKVAALQLCGECVAAGVVLPLLCGAGKCRAEPALMPLLEGVGWRTADWSCSRTWYERWYGRNAAALRFGGECVVAGVVFPLLGAAGKCWAEPALMPL